MGYYEDYLKELAKERARLRRGLEQKQEEMGRTLRGAHARRGLSFSGIAQKQLGELGERAQEAIARGESAISQEIAKVKASQKAERSAANAARAQALATLLGTGLGVAAGAAIPGVGPILGAQFGALAGSIGGGLLGGAGGYAPAYTTIPSSIVAAIEGLGTEELKGFMRELLDFYRTTGKTPVWEGGKFREFEEPSPYRANTA